MGNDSSKFISRIGPRRAFMFPRIVCTLSSIKLFHGHATVRNNTMTITMSIQWYKLLPKLVCPPCLHLRKSHTNSLAHEQLLMYKRQKQFFKKYVIEKIKQRDFKEQFSMALLQLMIFTRKFDKPRKHVLWTKKNDLLFAACCN